MFKILDSIFSDVGPMLVVCVSTVMLIVISIIDYLTGYEMAFSIFYGVPIAITSWYVNKLTGVVFSIISAIIWATVDYTSGHEYIHAWTLYWNASVRFGFFSVISVLLAELKAHLEYEKKLARTDSLTGIMNSHALNEATNTLLEIAIRHRQPYALGYIDLDNFKQVNDSWGHNEGDKVLKTVGAVLLKNIRTSDFAGRLGGDEFAIVLPLTEAEGAKQVFNKIQEQLLEAVKQGGWPIGFSIGVAIFTKNQYSANDSFKKADELMYQVKSGGKNNLIFQEF